MKVGIVGCGLVGRKRAFQLAGAELSYICDVDERNRNYLASDIYKKGYFPLIATSWEEVIKSKNVDIVIVATDHNSLVPVAAAALKHGKHVLVEKPACKFPRQLDALLKLEEEMGKVVRVGFNHRYHPAIQKAREIVDSCEIGPLMHLRCRYGHGGRKGYDKEWRSDPNLAAGGELVEQGIHIIDLAQWFLGDFTDVQGFATTSFWDQKLDDNAFLTLRTKVGQTAFMHVSCTEWKNTFSLEIFGEYGKVEVSGLGGSYGVERCTLYRRPENFGYPETTIWEYPGPDESWQVEFTDFLKDIQLGRTKVGLKAAKSSWEIINKIYQEKK